MHSAIPEPMYTPVSYTYTTINDPNSYGLFTKVYGLDLVAGVIGSGLNLDQQGTSIGFWSQSPYSKFQGINYPNAVSTTAAAVSQNGDVKAGYFIQAGGAITYAFVFYKGLWTLYKDPKTKKGPGTTTAILGINTSQIAVGWYTNAYGLPQAFEEYNNHFTDIDPPYAVSSMATGINKVGDVVGTEVLSDGSTASWIDKSGVFTTFSHPGSTDTEATGTNDRDEIVGSYVDASGQTHGFIVVNPGNPNKVVWQTIDEPNAGGMTVITGVNDFRTICGWYVDSTTTNTDGFVGTVKKG